MPDWIFYIPRVILDKENFYTVQLNDGLKAGLNPAIVRKAGEIQDNVVEELSDYLRRNDIEYATFNGSGEIHPDVENVKNSVNFCDKVNSKYGDKIIKKMTFKVGSLRTQAQEREERDKKNISRWGGDLVNFTAKDFLEGGENIGETVKEAVDYAEKFGIKLLPRIRHIENYATTEYLPELNEPVNDKRWEGSGWLSNIVNPGHIGTALDIPEIAPKGFCVEIGRLWMTEGLSKRRNFGNVGEPKNIDEYQQEALDKFGIYIAPGMPFIFKEPISAIDKIKEWGDKIQMAYVTGPVGEGTHFMDGNSYKKASLMPLLSPTDEDPLKIIESEEVRRELRTDSMKKLKGTKSALESAGCNEAVISNHLGKGIFSGDIWIYYQKTSKTNFKSL
ncbi:MAG: hypothetical protein JSV92_02880 [archaeon]|nr:MAG: hypothetical protein JSV92_02880 [archaeon]